MQRILYKMCKCPLQLRNTVVCMISVFHVLYYFCNFCRLVYNSMRRKSKKKNGYFVNYNLKGLKDKHGTRNAIGHE